MIDRIQKWSAARVPGFPGGGTGEVGVGLAAPSPGAVHLPSGSCDAETNKPPEVAPAWSRRARPRHERLRRPQTNASGHLHQRFNNLTDPEPIPVSTAYTSVIRSDTPIIVQHTRLDSRQAENALLSTIAYTE